MTNVEGTGWRNALWLLIKEEGILNEATGSDVVNDVTR